MQFLFPTSNRFYQLHEVRSFHLHDQFNNHTKSSPPVTPNVSPTSLTVPPPSLPSLWPMHTISALTPLALQKTLKASWAYLDEHEEMTLMKGNVVKRAHLVEPSTPMTSLETGIALLNATTRFILVDIGRTINQHFKSWRKPFLSMGDVKEAMRVLHTSTPRSRR